MNIVTKEVFDIFVSQHCDGRSSRVERDGCFEYECFDDKYGDEVAFIEYCFNGEVTYHAEKSYAPRGEWVALP